MFSWALKNRWSKNCEVNREFGALSGSFGELIITLSMKEMYMWKEGGP